MTTPLMLVRLGEGVYRDGPATMFALLDEEDVREIIPAVSEDEALAKARELAGARGVDCEPALEALARRRDARARPLTEAHAILKAHAALRMFAKDTYQVGMQRAPMMDFIEGAETFATGVADDDRDQWFVAGTVRGTAGKAAVDRDLFFLVQPGATPVVNLLARADADQLFTGDAELGDFDHMLVQLEQDPRVAAILEAAYDLALVPHASVVEGGKARAPDNIELDILAACLETLGRYAASKVITFAFEPRAGGKLTVKLSAYNAAS